MGEWIRSALDLILIVMVGIGLYQAVRLIRHLTDLRQGRAEMERFVHEFNATVLRAENGIKGLRQAARDSGDDLERLISKAGAVRDELHFLVESADQIAERLSNTASNVVKTDKPVAEVRAAVAPKAARPEAKEAMPPASSRAEKELLQALQKLN